MIKSWANCVLYILWVQTIDILYKILLSFLSDFFKQHYLLERDELVSLNFFIYICIRMSMIYLCMLSDE
jgi:hypothetical protein